MTARRFDWLVFALGGLLALAAAGCSESPQSIGAPHAIVNINVSQATLAALPRADRPRAGHDVLAAASVLRDTDPPRAVLYFAPEVGLSAQQATVVAHEVSHLTAHLLRVPDRTHEQDGGVLTR